MRRRRYLAGTAGVLAAGVAGCLAERVPGGGGTTDTPEPTPEPRPLGERVDVGDGTARVSNPRVQRTYVYEGAWKRVVGRASHQFLLVDVATEGFDRPRASWLDVALDGTPLDADAKGTSGDAGVATSGDADAKATSGDAGVATGTVAIPVPVGAVDAATVRWTEGESAAWRLPSTVVERFATAPRFSVRSARYSRGAGIVVEVANEGGRGGTFRMRASAGNAYDISSVVTETLSVGVATAITVPPGEISGLTPTPGREVDLSWGTGGTTVTVPADTSTPD